MNKIQVFHFHNGSGGGVLSVVRNIVEYQQHDEIENHVIYTINIEKNKDFKVPEIKGLISSQVFYYSSKWNFYYTCKQLYKLLPCSEAVIIAHDWLELGMVSNLGLRNPVVYFLHGEYFYYYDLAIRHNKIIDKFIPVANSIKANLLNLLPDRRTDICYLRFPVPEASPGKKYSEGCNIVFIGRLNSAKGYHLLPFIDEQLQQKEFYVNWHIVGSADDNEEAVKWGKNSRVKYYGNLPNCDVRSLLSETSLFILPSIAEGMPVTLIEAMKAGVIPIVNDLEGGIRELVIDNATGFRVKQNKVESYVEKIILLINRADLARGLKNKGIEKANSFFNPQANTFAIEGLFIEASKIKRHKKAVKVYGSRLDQRFIPNFITKSFR